MGTTNFDKVKADEVDATTLKKGAVEITASAAELNKLDGVTTTTAELNKLAGATLTTAELNELDLSVVGALLKVKKIAITAKGDTVENDTAFDLPAKAVVLDVFLDVTTAEATASTKTIDVGLLASESGGDADGFLDGISTGATGLQRGIPTLTTGSNEVYFASTTRGVLLESFTAGTDVATDVGTVYDKSHLSDGVTAKSVSWTAGEAQTEFAGDLYIVYIELG
ncbi:hypothetical protein IH992_03820 [Candidatus Poribacteria bacterium]|nr:hypothetical protein [Candidatus Poribacteria bacterium]